MSASNSGTGKLRIANDRYGLPDYLARAPSEKRATNQLSVFHPLEQKERNRSTAMIKDELALAQRVAGGALSQSLFVELHAASQAQGILKLFLSDGTGMPSSNLMMETLLGTDDEIDFGSFLRDSERLETHPAFKDLK